jgi:hypothetical protein
MKKLKVCVCRKVLMRWKKLKVWRKSLELNSASVELEARAVEARDMLAYASPAPALYSRIVGGGADHPPCAGIGFQARRPCLLLDHCFHPHGTIGSKLQGPSLENESRPDCDQTILFSAYACRLVDHLWSSPSGPAGAFSWNESQFSLALVSKGACVW